MNRFSRSMTVYSWSGDTWRKRTFGETETYATDLLPGFRLSLGDFFGVTDKYRDLE